MGGKLDTGSLSPADGGKLFSEGREKAKDMHSVALVMQTAAPPFLCL